MLYPGITKAACEAAFNVMVGSLAVAAEDKIANKFAGTLVVINPFIQPPDSDPDRVALDVAREAVLFKRRVADNHPDAEKYDAIALTKARDIWVLRALLGPNFTGRDIQQNCPHLYRPGMTKWHGGVCRFGVPYAFSGVQGNFDEALASTAASWVEAMGREAMTDKDNGVMVGSSSFIGGEIDTERISRLGAEAIRLG